MAVKVRFEPMSAGDVVAHSEGPEVEVERMRMETAEGAEITLEPEAESEGSWRVVSGPDEVEGHRYSRH